MPLLQRPVLAAWLFAAAAAFSLLGPSHSVAQVQAPNLSTPVPTVGDRKTTFQGSGTGFTPNSTASVMAFFPSGEPYPRRPDFTRHTGVQGRLTWRWVWARGDQVGPYRLSITDDTTHVTSNEVLFEIRAVGTPGPWRRALPGLVAFLAGFATIVTAISTGAPKTKVWKTVHTVAVVVGGLVVLGGGIVAVVAALT